MTITDKYLRRILAEEAMKFINEDPRLREKVIKRAQERLKKAKADA